MQRLLYILLFSVVVNISPLSAQDNFAKVGYASYYHDKFHGRKTASGETFSQDKMTCAHPSLPFGTVLHVTNLANGNSVTVTVNDRGPFEKGRIIDLSFAAAKELDFIKSGYTKVQIEVVTNDTIPELTTAVSDSVPIFSETIDTISLLPKDTIIATAKDTTEKIIAADTIPVATPLSADTDTIAAVYTVIEEGSKKGHYSVQISSFAVKSNMERMIADLNKEFGNSVYVIVKGETGNETYNVMLGLFDNREDAAAYMSKVVLARFPDAFIYEVR